MSRTRTSTALLRVSLLAAAFAAVSIPAASAKKLELTYTGTFSTADALNLQSSAAAGFTSTTPFLITALFDDSSQNLVAPVGMPGFVAYSPISATLTVSGQVYSFMTYAQNPAQGISIAVFDASTPFGPPGHYAVGVLQNPLADGAGIIGDFASVSSPFTANSLHSTVFTGYTGVGTGSGPDLHDGHGPTTVPILLSGTGGNVYNLTLGNYDEEFADGSVQNTAVIHALPVPETSSVVSLAVLFALGLGAVVVRRKVRA